jgi:hypothetical protein
MIHHGLLWGEVIKDMKILLHQFSSWKSNLCLPVANKPSRALACYAHAYDEAIVCINASLSQKLITI